MNKRIIGLCGGSGSGKGAVGKIFSDNGYLVIDTDKVYRELTEKSSECLDALAFEFGEEILNSDGSLNRRKLADIVFSDKIKHSKLNEITHKFVLNKVFEIISATSSDSYVGTVVDAPMLFESGFDKECNYIVAVVSDRKKRIERIISRDGISEEAAVKRINAQTDDAELIKRVDFVIENNKDLATLKYTAEKIINKINEG